MTNTNQMEDLMSAWGDMWTESWSAWTRAAVHSDTFASAATSCLDWNLETQKQFRSMMGQYLEALEVPRRSDLARLSQQIQALEARVLDAEEQIDMLGQKLCERMELLTEAVTSLEKNTKSSTTRRKKA